MKRLWTHILVGALLVAPGAASGVMYDYDDDGDIDLVDYVAFEACLDGPTVPYADPGCEVFDGNSDSYIDLWDFGGLQRAFVDVGPTVIYPAQLAGNSLAEYPYFEYVKAFNENATVEVAIDPGRYPDIVGRTCDVYVVEAKSSTGWALDPALNDVTAGGPQTETFGGANIQGNTFMVTGSFELDADAGIGLGVGYDMVLDCDQDGELSLGDYIDGLGNEAGLYAVHDTTQPGPLAVTELATYSVGTVYGIPSGRTNENTFYPTGIAGMGQLPLIVISHGNGHDYQWYDHIGNHMASYGYIVMSHQNNTGPGIETASTTTLGHTDAILDQQDSIGGGVLDGHIDSTRITWIGHSRGAEGIARAFDRIVDGYTPEHYTTDDIVLLSSMLPTDFLGTNSSDPHWANYHLWTAAGDADVSGTAANDIAQTFHLHDRATHYRQSTVVQGTGHGDFHDGSGGDVFTGPCHIVPRIRVHEIQTAHFLAMIKHYVEGNIPANDFLVRQYERFHPIGVDLANPCIVVTNEYRNGSDRGNFFIDDYQTETGLDTSSSGGAVTYTVNNVEEGRLDDNNSSFSWTASDPFNGATQARSSDTTRGCVFDWNGDNLFYEWEIIPEQRNFSNYLYVAFRGAQGTQHPYTLAFLGDETFSVTLRDSAGRTSSINIGAYGGGLEQPYQRSGGWHNEMEAIRIRLTDFLNNDSGLDLSDIVAVRFDVGPSRGSAQGRVVVDELMLTNDYPWAFVPLTLTLPTAPPEFIPPGVPTTIDVELNEGNDSLVPGSALLYYRYDDGAFLSVPLEQIAGDLYQGTLPAPACGDRPEYYFAAEGVATGQVYQPMGAPGVVYSSNVGTEIILIDDDFEIDFGWTVESIDLTDGEWERGIPVSDGVRGDPTEDYDGSGQCYLTANRLGNSDVDGGPTMLISPTLDMSTMSDPVFRYARWWSNDDQDADPFDVDVSNDGGANWVRIERVINIGVPTNWVFREVHLVDFITLTDQMQVRFSVMDNPSNSVDEGAVDAVKIFDVACE